MNKSPHTASSLTLALVAAVALAGCGSIKWPPAAPLDFYNRVQTRMPLEARYTALGPASVTSQTFPSGQSRFREFKVWYPESLPGSTGRYPVVVFANGSGTAYSKYEAVFAHLASWGFVVIGNDDESSWNGSSTSQSLAFLQQQAQDPSSPFYQRLDVSRVGVSGHSQGGVGAINAVTNFDNSNRFASIYTASATKHPLAVQLQWNYDVAEVRVPYFMVAGTGQVDAGIAPLESMRDNYARVSRNGLTVLARRSGTDHAQTLYVPNGYMVAWFRYTLMDDREAARVFTGDSPEIRRNTGNWQDIQIKTSR